MNFARRALLSVALLALAVFSALYVWLSFSPISMTFLVPTVEKAVNRALPGMRFDIGDAVLCTDDRGVGIELRLTNVSLTDDAGGRIVEAPMASADVSLKALLNGRLAVGEVELIGTSVYMQYSEEKGLALSFGDPRTSKTDLGAIRPSASPSNQNANQNTPGTQPESRQITQQPVPTPAGQNSAGTAPVRMAFNPHAQARAINLTRAFNNVFDMTRKGESAYLTSFGMRDAVVHFDHGDQVTSWEVPTVQIDLEHAGKNSAVFGHASVKTALGLSRMDFQASINQRSQQLALAMSVKDWVPQQIIGQFKALNLPNSLNLPVSLAAEMELAGNGDILSAELKAALKGGEVYAPWDQKHPAVIDSGLFHIVYSREDGRIEVKPSSLQWGGSEMAFSGVMDRQPATGRWGFRLVSEKLAFGAEQFGVPVIPLDGFLVQGEYDPKRGATVLDRVFLHAADAQISLTGSIVQGQRSPAIRMTGQISRMPVAFAKLIWPPFVANGARDWIGKRIPAGRIAGGTLKVDIPADALADIQTNGLPHGAVDFRLDLEDLEIHYLSELPPLIAPKGTASVSGQRFFFVAPEADIRLPSGERVRFTDGEYIVGDLRPRIPDGEIHFKTQSSAKAGLELLNHPPLHYIDALGTKVPDINAATTTTFSLTMPMIKGLKFKDIKLAGRAHVEDIRATNLPGGMGIHGGKLDFEASEKAIEVRGDVKMNGMPVTVAWQRIFDAAPEQQPPLRLRTVLDEAARKEMGLEVNHILRGNIASELMVNLRKEQQPLVHLEINLSEADVIMGSLGWRKPPGQRAVLNTEIEQAEGGATALRNITLLGDNLTVRGEVMLDDARKPVSFSFPLMELNEQTRLDMSGELGRNNVWTVRAAGPSFDGRQFFRSLFSAGQLTEDQPQLPKDAPGMDVKAEFGTVTGYFDTAAQNITIEAKRRNNKLVYLDMHGRLNKDLVAARVETKEGQPRYLLAEATDAGAAFRLVGLYSSARGGEASLKVNLDGSGPAEKVGILYASNFTVINDQVVGQAVSKNSKRREQQNRPQPQYEQIDFDEMRAPFSVGYGQFVLHDGILNGPIMGITLRGNVDFKRERINLSGTYTPAFALNNAASNFPILGMLLGGREGEGLLGVTFAVQGPLSRPDVQVNPLSAFLPGATRQIMEFDQTVPHIIPPEQRKQGKSGGKSSSLPPATR